MRVWDLPLRIFHWGLMICVFAAIGSSKAGVMWAHERFGLTVLALVAFRVIWGFVGGYHARFANFVKGPLAVLRWLRQSSGQSSGKKGIEQPREIGHSPIAAYSVLALLAVAGFMAMSGTMSNDGILFDGPLAHLVPNFTRDATKAHHFGQFIVFALVGLHVAAIIFYKLVKKHGLTSAMVRGRTGDVELVKGEDGGISAQRTWFGLLLMVGLIALAQLLPMLKPY